MSSKKAGRGRPPVDSERIDSRFNRDLLNGIDAFARSEPDGPSRPEALRRILRDWLNGHGYLGASDEALRLDQLNAENDG